MQTFKQFIAEAKDSWFSRNDNEGGGYGSTPAAINKNLGKGQVRHEGDGATLTKYTAMSRVLNRVLHSDHKYGKPEKRHSTDEHGFDVDHVDAAVNRNTLSHDLHVYHGAHFDASKEAAKHPEGHVHLPAYTSTTTDKKVARGFSNANGSYEHHILHLHLKAGQKGAYVGKEKDNYNSDQREFVLPRNSTIKVHGSEQVSHQGRTYTIHHATVV